jgi:hypothetical protein
MTAMDAPLASVMVEHVKRKMFDAVSMMCLINSVEASVAAFSG